MYKLLSHNDLDGVSCGILAKLAFGESIEVRYNSVTQLDREVKNFLENDTKDTFLFITDLSVNQENTENLAQFVKNGGKVQLIDHHKTALHFNEYDWAKVEVEHANGKLASATSLFYEYLVEHNLLTPTQSLNEYVELVRQYDTWEWEMNNNQKANRLNSLFFLISIEEFEEKMLERLPLNKPFEFDDFEKKLLDMEDEKIERYIRKKRRELVQTEIHDYFVGIVYAESYHSQLGNVLGKDYPHLDYIAILNMGGKKMSFRTIHDHVDVSEVAANFGGGGHAKASGCSMTEETFQLYVQNTFHLEPIHEDARNNEFNTKESEFGTLYQNSTGDKFFIKLGEKEHEWTIEKNNKPFEQTFMSFFEAEKYLKRKEAAWLVRDEIFVKYLIEQINKK